jgi:hypothetical protein
MAGFHSVITSKFKHFICILITVVTFKSSQILKFLFGFKSISNSDRYLNFHSNSVVIQAKSST